MLIQKTTASYRVPFIDTGVLIYPHIIKQSVKKYALKGGTVEHSHGTWHDHQKYYELLLMTLFWPIQDRVFTQCETWPYYDAYKADILVGIQG